MAKLHTVLPAGRRSTAGNSERRYSYTIQKGAFATDALQRLLLISVGATGFEPATSCSRSRRATGLRYAPNTTQRPSTRETLTHVNTHSRPTGARIATRFAVCNDSRKSRKMK